MRIASMLVLLALSLISSRAWGQDWAKVEAEAVERLQQYFRIDTSNPPGNEKVAAEFFCKLFSAEGIECQIFEIAPGRANAYARLHGNGPKRPLILLNHTDVVQADAKSWSVPPFSGAVRDGAMYGRGAQDMKSEGMLQAMVMLALKREQVPLARDVIFLAVADEEVSGLGTDWMVANKKELLADAEYLINEGGENIVEDGAVPFWTVSVGEKIPYWLRLTARGRAGHGSRPRRDAAPHRLARALARVVDFETPLRVLPMVQKIFCDMARVRYAQEREKFCNLEASLRDLAFRKRLTENPDWNYMLRDTISLTVMKGGPQTNVIPAEAVAELDIRLLPGSDPEAMMREIRRLVADDGIEVELMSPYRVPNSSPADTELWRSFESVVAKHFPGTIVTPRLSSGYTESQVYRQLGIHAYGFSPFVTPPEEARTAHGTDERIAVAAYKQGLRILYDMVSAIARQ